MAANGINGRFEARELTFKVSANEFVVDCGQTAQLADGVECTQQTFKTLALALTEDNLPLLMEALETALNKLRSERRQET